MKVRIYKKKIKDFLKHVTEYCEDNDLENDFKTFLFHKKNDFCSPAYYFLHLAPKLYLANSKCFADYYYSLDKDFQEDIITTKEIKYFMRLVNTNQKLKNLLKTFQKNDAIY